MKRGDIVKYSKPVNEIEAQFRFILLVSRKNIQFLCDYRIKPIETMARSATVESRPLPSGRSATRSVQPINWFLWHFIPDAPHRTRVNRCSCSWWQPGPPRGRYVVPMPVQLPQALQRHLLGMAVEKAQVDRARQWG
jgi:hypothetical protein